MDFILWRLQRLAAKVTFDTKTPLTTTLGVLLDIRQKVVLILSSQDLQMLFLRWKLPATKFYPVCKIRFDSVRTSVLKSFQISSISFLSGLWLGHFFTQIWPKFCCLVYSQESRTLSMTQPPPFFTLRRLWSTFYPNAVSFFNFLFNFFFF